MWWLSFRDGGVVIISASSLAHARLLAARNGLGRASHFVEGHFIDPERMAPVRPEHMGRMLSPIEARQLWELVSREPQNLATERKRRPVPKPSRLQN